MRLNKIFICKRKYLKIIMIILKKINNDFLFLTLSTIFGTIIKFIFSIYTKKHINPTDVGMFSAFSLITVYLNYFQLGTLNAYNRDYPQLLGGKEYKKAIILKNNVLSYVLICYTTIISFVILIIIYRYYYRGIKYVLCSSLLVFSVLTNVINNFGSYTSKINGDFNYSAIVYIIQSFLGVIFGIIIIKYYGYVGLYSETLIYSIIGCILLTKYIWTNYKFTIDFRVLKYLFWSGIPLMINNFIWTIVGSIDRFLIIKFIDIKNLGYYTIANMAFSTIMLIPHTISHVFYIKLSKEYGEYKNNQKLVMSANKYTFICSYITSFICFFAFVVIPFFVNYLMPKYRHGIYPAQILIIGVTIYSSTLLYGNIFTIIKRNKILLQNSTYLCIYNLFISLFLVLIIKKSIEYVALGTSISYSLYSCLLIYRIKKILKIKIKNLFCCSWIPVLIAVIPCIFYYYIGNNYIVEILVIFLFGMIFTLLYSYKVLYRKCFQL